MSDFVAYRNHCLMNNKYCIKKNPEYCCIRDLVQETGLEPTQAFARYHLKVVRLPIPPLLRARILYQIRSDLSRGFLIKIVTFW